MTDPTSNPEAEPVAETAGQEDHENVEMFRGEQAEAPEDVGRPEDTTP